MDYLTPAQCRAARALLDWSQPDLAERCGMHVQTISAFENETGTPTKRTLSRITDTLEAGGIELMSDDGVKRKRDTITRYSDREGFEVFMHDVYETIKSEGGEVCVSNVNETLYYDLLGAEFTDFHVARMNALIKERDFNFKIIIKSDDDFTPASGYAEYRSIDKKFFGERCFYAYGEKLALISFSKDTHSIVVLNDKEFTDSYRIIFNIMWEKVGQKM